MPDPENTATPATEAAKAPAKVAAPQVAATPAEPASAPPEAPPAPVAEDPAAASLNRKFLEWTHGHIYGGPIARNTDCWNALQAALPALRASILKGD